MYFVLVLLGPKIKIPSEFGKQLLRCFLNMLFLLFFFFYFLDAFIFVKYLVHGHWCAADRCQSSVGEMKCETCALVWR